MKKKLFTLLLLIAMTPVFAQLENLTCLDFTKGEFKDINSYNVGLNSTVFRKGDKQTEITNEVKSVKRISWHNDCNYSLFFSKKEAHSDKAKKFINKNGGVTVIVNKIKGKTLYYTTSYFNGKQKIKGEGMLIKVSSNTRFE